MRWSWHSGWRICFVTLSSSFRGLDYRGTLEEVGALARYFTGWTRADLMSLTVRERRYRIEEAIATTARQKREAERQAWLREQQVKNYER